MQRNFSSDPEDFKKLIGRVVRRPNMTIYGKIVDVVSEINGRWDSEWVLVVFDDEEKMTVNALFSMGLRISG